MTTHKELVERRFFIDHGMIHDRVTGRHVATDPEMLGLGGSMLDDALDLLNSLTAEIEAMRIQRDDMAAHILRLMGKAEGTEMSDLLSSQHGEQND